MSARRRGAVRRACGARSSSCTAPTTASSPTTHGARLAELTGGTLVTFEGTGPRAAGPASRSRSTGCSTTSLTGVTGPEPPSTDASAPRDRPKRVLYLSSPIGLGHVRRDLAIADELRQQRPGRGDRVAVAVTGDRLPGEGGGAGPSGVGVAGERERPRRVGVRRARPARVPGDPADGRDPGRQLHGLRRPGPRARLRPLDRRRGLGPRPLPAREPAVSSARRSPG